MGMMKDRAGPHRRICPLIFMLDTSGSMNGQPIGAVNSAMENILPELVSMNSDNADVEIQIAVLTFNSDVCWETGDQLVDPESFKRFDLRADGTTEMGKAFLELKSKLSLSKGFMNRASGSVAPVLFLLSDGEPTDDYKDGLVKLQENAWYNVAHRVAIGYGDANETILAKFTKFSETVLFTNDPMELKEMIKFVTITTTQVASNGSKRTTTDTDDNTVALAEELKDYKIPESTGVDEIWDD